MLTKIKFINKKDRKKIEEVKKTFLTKTVTPIKTPYGEYIYIARYKWRGIIINKLIIPAKIINKINEIITSHGCKTSLTPNDYYIFVNGFLLHIFHRRKKYYHELIPNLNTPTFGKIIKFLTTESAYGDEINL